MRNVLTPMMTALVMAGCAVGPDYVPPVHTDRTGRLGAQTQIEAKDAIFGFEAESAWWEMFDDPVLTSLVHEAIVQNHDLVVAVKNVRVARALRQSESGALSPQIGTSGNYAYQRSSENGAVNLGALSQSGVAELETNLLQFGFDASWEIDIFGGRARRVEAAQAQIGSAIEHQRDVMITVISEVARNYGELRGAQARIDVVRNNIQIQNQTLKLVTAKYRSGIGSELDVSRARTNLNATRAGLPALRANQRAAAHRLGVLTARQPTELLDLLLASKPLPISPDSVPTGLQSDLLSRRPDVRRAERELAAASANTGIAVAEFYPKFSLTGAAGQQSVSFSDLFKGGSTTWSIGPEFSLPLFTGRRLEAGLDAAKAQQNIAASRYEQAVLLAIEDVETSLVRYVEAQQQTDELVAAVEANEASVRLAQALYENGLGEFLDVLDAERSLSDLEDRLAASRTEVFVRTIALYKALGGGWKTVEAKASKA